MTNRRVATFERITRLQIYCLIGGIVAYNVAQVAYAEGSKSATHPKWVATIQLGTADMVLVP